MNVEIELKMRVPPGSAPKLRRHPLVKSPVRPVKLLSVYYDTPSLDLKSKAVALRLRKVGARWIQTVKGGGGELAGVHTRSEWEAPVARNALDFTKIDEPFLVELFGNPELRRRLEPVFVTEFSRKIVPVEFAGSLIEYCFDTGKIVSAETEEAISEVELELKSGSPSALFEFALELQKTVPLFIESRSKAERGYALFMGGAINSVKKAGRIDLSRKMNVSSALKEIVRGCLLQIQGNAKGMLDGEEDCEYLHQMRVGLRRLRSAFSVFSRHFGSEPFSAIIPELRWLGGELGPARNWDVFILETLPPILDAMRGHCDLGELFDAGQALRRKHRERAVEAVASQRFQALLLELGAVLSREGWPGGGDSPVEDFASRILEKRYRNFLKGGKNLAALQPEELHLLRISGKKLRYAAEFFSSLYPAHAVRPFVRAMTGFQDVLGSINDAETTGHLLEELTGIDTAASCLIRGWVGCDSGHHAAQLGRQWKEFGDMVPFWK